MLHKKLLLNALILSFIAAGGTLSAAAAAAQGQEEARFEDQQKLDNKLLDTVSPLVRENGSLVTPEKRTAIEAEADKLFAQGARLRYNLKGLEAALFPNLAAKYGFKKNS